MSTLFEKQICLRLSGDGTSFFYTVRYGRLFKITREMRLVAQGDTRGLAELSGVPHPSGPLAENRKAQAQSS
jgi:hypothetical protein